MLVQIFICAPPILNKIFSFSPFLPTFFTFFSLLIDQSFSQATFIFASHSRNFILCECSLNHFEQENRYWSPSRLSIPKITLKRFLVLEISVDYNAVLSFHGASFWRDNKAIKHGNERKPSTQSRGEPLLLCRNSYLSM